MFTALFVAALAACATPPIDGPATHSAYEPAGEPGSGQELLARMAGDWSVQKTFFGRNDSAPRTSHGECHQAMVLDGRFLQSDFTFDVDGAKTAGMGITGFDPQSGLFTSFWVDSRQTRTSVRRSKPGFDGAQIELWSVSLDAGETRRSRTVTRFEDQDRILHTQFSLQADGAERRMMELVLTRKPAAAQ